MVERAVATPVIAPRAHRQPALPRVGTQAPDAAYGTARVSVCSTFVVQRIYGAIQQYSGTAQPAWLDLATR